MLIRVGEKRGRDPGGGEFFADQKMREENSGIPHS